jgi:hypothetical protein
MSSKRKLLLPLLVMLLTCWPVMPSLGEEHEGQAERTSLFNELWLDAVISIERRLPPEEWQEEDKIFSGYRALGVGFLVQTAHQHILQATAKHVIESPTQTLWPKSVSPLAPQVVSIQPNR